LIKGGFPLIDWDNLLQIAGAIWLFSLITYLIKKMIDKFWGNNG